MSQIGEAIAAFFGKDDPEKKIKKKKLKIRFSLFFDGTLNNRTNIEEREKAETGAASESYKEEGDGGSNSYDNGRTNIAIMEPLVPIAKKKNGYNYSFKIYIEGQGTFDRGGDSTLGYAMGEGTSGVSSRARKGIQKAMEMLQDFLKDYPPEEYEIEKIDVDVFGFSRGAATARHCIFLMTDTIATSEDRIPLYVRLRWLGYSDTTAKQIEIKFAGLYDTVVSVNVSQWSYWSDDKLNQTAVKLATQSLHLAAAEEHRLDFPLHTIKSAKDIGNGKEYYLPGVHSDVGGSYNLANALLLNKKGMEPSTVKIVLEAGSYKKMTAQRDQLIAWKYYTADNLIVEATALTHHGLPTEGKLIELRTHDNKEYMRSSSEVGLIINEGDNIKLKQDRDWLEAQGWYNKNELYYDIKKFLMGGGFEGNLVTNRKNIKSAYSNIPLKIMAKEARKNQIEIDAQLEKNANIILNKEPDLLTLEADITSYIAKKGNSSEPKDWLAEKPDDIKANMKTIRHDHLHMSAKLGMGYNPRFKKGKRLRYYYEG